MRHTQNEGDTATRGTAHTQTKGPGTPKAEARREGGAEGTKEAQKQEQTHRSQAAGSPIDSWLRTVQLCCGRPCPSKRCIPMPNQKRLLIDLVDMERLVLWLCCCLPKEYPPPPPPPRLELELQLEVRFTTTPN